MEDINVAFGAHLARLRKDAGLTQQDFAVRVGMSRSAIANIESGKQGIVLTAIFSFAQALDKIPTELIPLVSLESKIKSAIPDEINRELLLSLAYLDDHLGNQ